MKSIWHADQVQSLVLAKVLGRFCSKMPVDYRVSFFVRMEKTTPLG
jgi:hypothetical protein